MSKVLRASFVNDETVILSVSEALEDHNASENGDRDDKLIDYLYNLFEIEPL